MPIVFSLSYAAGTLWSAGPDGLFRYTDAYVDAGANPQGAQVAQPQAELACCLALENTLLVGGAPHGVAFSTYASAPNASNTSPIDEGQGWQAGWLEENSGRVLCLVAAPHVATSGVLLAGSESDGIWRSRDTGRTWATCNVGLYASAVLCLAWAPPAPAGRWPAWDVVLAGTEEGAYRSPNGGLAWKRSDGLEGVVQCLAVGTDFHHTGLALAGTESDGLWRSTDGGHRFAPVDGSPQQVNALTAVADGWLMSDAQQLWHSPDGETWTPLPATDPALTLLASPAGVWAGGAEGVQIVKR